MSGERNRSERAVSADTAGGGLAHAALTAAVAALVVFAAALAAGPARAQVTGPVFIDGQAQPVFSAVSSSWIRQEGWAESTIDSDFDGKLDRIHFDIVRAPETDLLGLKIPVVMEVSPYYAGGANVPNWGVDHEIGFPPTTKAGFTRTIGNTSPIISSAHNSTWVPRGFAVMHVEGTGTGHSEGCPTSGDVNETLGPKAVIDWLNGNAKAYTSPTSDTEIFPTWTTGKVGMIGTSYNGTLPIGIATTGVEGLEAIVPISAISSWYDYYRANGAVRAPGGFQGEDLDVLADYTYSRANQQICQPVIENIRQIQDRVTGDYSPIWASRNYMNDVHKVRAASLVAHGNNDWNVMTKHAAEYYEALRARGVPHQLYWHQGGHGGSPPLALTNRWFSRYLWGVENWVEGDPKAWVVREAATCPPRTATVVGDHAATDTLTVASTADVQLGMTITVPQTNSTGTITNTTRVILSIPNGTTLVLASAVATAAGQRVVDGAVLSIACNASNPSPYPEWPDPAVGTASLTVEPGSPASGTLGFREPVAATETVVDNASTNSFTATALMNAATSPNRLVFRTAPLAEAIRLSGTPEVTIRAAFSKPKANLTAILVHYPSGTGNGTILTRGWIDPENPNDPGVTEPITPGEYRTLTFDLQPKDSIVPAGRRLGLMIISSDREYTVRPAPGTEVAVDLAATSLRLPVVGGARTLGLATGVTEPAIAYTLDPAAPTGDDGWYTGAVALDWELADTGAALDLDGCVDETFADGVHTRSCEVSNVVGSAGPVEVTVKRDATAPVVEVTGVAEGAVYVLGTEPDPGCATSDGTRGVAADAILGKAGGPTVGFFTAACSGARDAAGNTASATATYQVVYDFGGFESPLADGVNDANAGSAVPVKFALAGDHGLGVLADGSPSYVRTSCSTGAALAGSTPAVATSPFRYAGDGYVFVWKTPKSLDGACARLDVALEDGTTRSARFDFRQ